jgi:hypothetical protein
MATLAVATGTTTENTKPLSKFLHPSKISSSLFCPICHEGLTIPISQLTFFSQVLKEAVQW